MANPQHNITPLPATAAAAASELPDDVEPYSMHVSSRYLDLTKKKLELTRMPREVPLLGQEGGRWALGTPKAVLEPLLDYWLESYDWRAQERQFNSSLRQFRTTIEYPPPPAPAPVEDEGEDSNVANDPSNVDIEATAAVIPTPTPTIKSEPLRIHFLHHPSPSLSAIPLLYIHTWPGSFLEISRAIDALVNPVDTPPADQTWRDPIAFHVVAPSIPGFAFSDASTKVGFGARDAAGVFVALMRKLGYERFGVWGDGWGFKIARQIALHHPDSVAAVYTSNPKDLPAPQALRHKDAWLKYQIAKFTGARFPWLSFGYTSSDFGMAGLKIGDDEEGENVRRGRAQPNVLRKKRSASRSARADSGGEGSVADAVEMQEQQPAPPAAAAVESAPTKGSETKNNDATAQEEDPKPPFPSFALSSRPQTLSYSLCDSPAGLLALILDVLKPSITPPPPSQPPPTSPPPRRRSATVLQHEAMSLPVTQLDDRPAFSATDVLNWTMMFWLPGPEASLRFLLAAEQEDCYAAYSDVPLGMTWFDQSTATTSGRTAGNAETASPMWARAVQDLKWVRRREQMVDCGVPAWERSAETVLDVREFFGVGREEGWLGL